MTGRMRIVDRWRTRLTANQRIAAECPAHRRWVHQVYVQVYGFLISCYGAGGTIATLVYSIGWGIFALAGAIVGVWRYYKTNN